VAIIAHYKERETTIRSLGYLSLIGLLLVLAFRNTIAAGDFTPLWRRPFLLPILVGGCLFTTASMLMFAVVLKRVLLDGCRALWIEVGNIVFLHKWNISIAIDAVEDISIGTFGRFEKPAILFRLKSGTTRAIPTGSFREDPTAIVERLKGNIMDAANASKPPGERGQDPMIPSCS
jgi:hypothetical protein